MRLLLLSAVTALVFPLLPAPAVLADNATKTPKLEAAELGSTRNVHSFGKTLLCGQPAAEDFAEANRRGIGTIITLRQPGEVEWDEADVINRLGLQFHRFGFGAPDTLTNSVFDGALRILADPQKQPVMLHCGSANRVGAVWLAHRVLNDGISLEEARQEAKTVGLRTAAYEAKALAYIEQRQADPPEPSIRPGINDRFKDPALDVAEWLGRFEIESREVYSARSDVLEACQIQPGSRVVDVGAGTGFFCRLFAEAVGEEGWVFAVDIAPRFLEHINRMAQDDGVENLTCILGADRSSRLPPNSVDVAFICDTYHHFEYPHSMLASLHRALKPGGTLILIDFERIPGKSREFILGHVRAGKEVFRQETVSAGFTFVEEAKIPKFQENYLLRFRKDEQTRGE